MHVWNDDNSTVVLLEQNSTYFPDTPHRFNLYQQSNKYETDQLFKKSNYQNTFYELQGGKIIPYDDHKHMM